MNPAKITTSFIQRHRRPAAEREWLKAAFGVMLRVARRNPEFCMDDVWVELDKAYASGALPDIDMDHRVLGPMLLHMCRVGLISASGYYIKSVRPGGGSRPLMIWDSHLYTKVASAA